MRALPDNENLLYISLFIDPDDNIIHSPYYISPSFVSSVPCNQYCTRIALLIIKSGNVVSAYIVYLYPNICTVIEVQVYI